MNKEWDSDKGGKAQWIEWLTSVMRECYRTLKPGAHIFVWAIPRRSNWTMNAIEDSGFDIRDVLTHVQGQGFSKSMDVGKQIEKNFETELAEQWTGFGTALKPSAENWILARKPISEKTIAENVLKYSTGAINIDASRIAWDQKSLENDTKRRSTPRTDITSGSFHVDGGRPAEYIGDTKSPPGRFPSNFVLSHSDLCDIECVDDCPVKMLNDQSGFRPTSARKGVSGSGKASGIYNQAKSIRQTTYADSGGASRFFYCPKANKKERGEGNNHPCVKNSVLLNYLHTMICPPGGITLDPFMGSGSVGLVTENFVGIESNADYFEIAKKRLT